MNYSLKKTDLAGCKITLMGLGLNGGGLETAKFLLKNGADLTVTDNKTEKELRSSLEELAGYRFRTVFGRHEMEDFSKADLVIKNPAVRPNNPYVQAARRIETDLSLFFMFNANPVLGVTGSKGKSTTSSAIHHGLKSAFPGARLGGNITLSPLCFLDELKEGDPVVLELSSFQLGDLTLCASFPLGLLSFPPKLALITNIFHDHQDYYPSMDSYLADKQVLCRFQGEADHTVLFGDDPYVGRFSEGLRSQAWFVNRSRATGPLRQAYLEDSFDLLPSSSPFVGPRGWLTEDAEEHWVLPAELSVAGKHHRMNLLAAACALKIWGLSDEVIRDSLGSFRGVEHRLETVASKDERVFINDSAATIPEAVLAAVTSLDRPIHLICGGTDKNLSFKLFPLIREKVKSLSLLKGSASEKIAETLKAEGKTHDGVFEDFDACLESIYRQSDKGDIVLLSPGCASFGLFLNEFDRGRKFKDAVLRLGKD